jgi:hypothetical protein
MNKESLANYIANEIQYLSKIEREELKSDLMKMKSKSVRWIAEHIEDSKEAVEV